MENRREKTISNQQKSLMLLEMDDFMAHIYFRNGFMSSALPEKYFALFIIHFMKLYDVCKFANYDVHTQSW